MSSCPTRGRSGVWLYTKNWCKRNGLDRGLKFDAVRETSLALQLWRSIPGTRADPKFASHLAHGRVRPC